MSANIRSRIEVRKRSTWRQNDALILSGVATVMLILLGLTGLLILPGQERIWSTLILLLAGVIAIAGLSLLREENYLTGTTLTLVAMAGAFLFLTIGFSGLGIWASIVFTTFGVTFVALALPERWFRYGFIFTAAFGLLLLFLDLNWPGTGRIELSDATARALLVAMGLGLIGPLFSLRRFPEYSLREKLVVVILGAALFPLLALVVLGNRSTRGALIQEANDRLLSAARQTSVSLDDFFSTSLKTIRTEAGVLEETSYFSLPQQDRASEEDEILRQLKVFRDKDPLIINSYAILDPQGRIILEYPTNAHQVDEVGRDYLVTPMESGEPYASAVEFEDIPGGPFLYFSMALHNENDRPFAVLRARYKAVVLQELVARSTGLVGGQSFAVLFDENLLHLAHGTSPETIFKLTASIDPNLQTELQAEKRLPSLQADISSTELPELAERLKQAEEVPIFAAQDVATGAQIDQVAVTGMAQQDWLVAFFQPQEVFLASIADQTRNAILLATAASAAIVVLAVLLSRYLTRPIIRLEQAAAQVARGDLSVRADIKSADEIGTLAETFNLMTSRLQTTLEGLEQRVADRTRALATSTEVGRRLSTILDQNQLVKEVVEQVREAFNYYHAHIYFFDNRGENLVMVGGTGEPGRIMLERGHQIAGGRGLVGRAADTNAVVLVPDVTREPAWLANPLLPKTRSEVAVPISIGDRVLGVLDVQDDEINGLQEEDADLLLSIANQVAIALQNAQSYAQIRRQAERRALINEINRKIQSTSDDSTAMQVAVRELGRAVRGRYTRVWLNNPAEKKNGNKSGQD